MPLFLRVDGQSVNLLSSTHRYDFNIPTTRHEYEDLLERAEQENAPAEDKSDPLALNASSRAIRNMVVDEEGQLNEEEDSECTRDKYIHKSMLLDFIEEMGHEYHHLMEGANRGRADTTALAAANKCFKDTFVETGGDGAEESGTFKMW